MTYVIHTGHRAGRYTMKSDRIIRTAERRHKTGLSESQLNRMEKAGNFPKRIRITTKTVGWSERAVDVWVAERIAGAA